MIKWEKVIREGKIILKKENWEKLWQPYIKMSDKAGSEDYSCFVWEMYNYKGHKLIVHDGANTGFRSIFSRFVNDGLSIIILANTDEAIREDIANAPADYYFRK